MAKHVIERESVPVRIRRAIGGMLLPAVRLLSRILRPFTRQNLIGFFAVAAFTAVSIVDPYSGNLASASTFDNYQASGDSPDQVYGWGGSQTISYSRGGYSILTGQDAAALFVAQAAIPSSGTVQAIAYSHMNENKWGMDQYSCLVKLWTRESNWRVNAYNASSGAYGIPQALPGVKMASVGADWLTNPETQILWGLDYIKSRFGSPCGALAHSNRFGWY